MPFDILISAFPYLLKGAVITFWLAVVTIVAGSLLGAVLGILSVFAPASVRAAITAYVFVIRGIAILVLMFLTYYALPAMGVLLGDYVTVSGALIVYCGAYVTEIVRGAILAVSRTQVEAAKGLGMRRLQYIRGRVRSGRPRVGAVHGRTAGGRDRHLLAPSELYAGKALNPGG